MNIEDNIINMPPVWQRVTSYFTSLVMISHLVLPGTVQAYEIIEDSSIQSEVNYAPQFERKRNNEHQFEKAYYIGVENTESAQNLLSFHQKLYQGQKLGLPEPVMLPIFVGDITVILPHYPVEKRIGDAYVQGRLIRLQIQSLLDRTVLPRFSAYKERAELEQINGLYNNAYAFARSSYAQTNGINYGDKLSRKNINDFGKDLIWPELRFINSEAVLVPIVHLTDSTINADKLSGHRVELGGETAKFRNISVESGTLFARRNAFIGASGSFLVGERAKVIADEDLNLIVGGTLFNTGTLGAKGNVDILAGQYGQKTVVHRFATKYEQGTRLGKIAHVGADGTISIQTAGDIKVVGGTLSGRTIKFNAGKNITIASQDTTYVRNQVVKGYRESDSFVEHYGSRLDARDSIYLMAAGQVEINASELVADEGVLSILAQQGVHIVNSFDQYQSSKSGKVRKTTLQERQFQSIAIRSALEAGKNVVISSEFGDIKLKAAALSSTKGTEISAHNGKVDLLLAKEQDHFYQQTIKKNFWRVKTTTIDKQNENAIYNSIIGGVNIQATKGLTLELGMKDSDTLEGVLSSFRKSPELVWMAELYDDPEYRDNAELVYQKLVQINKKDTSRQLGAGPMAIIAIVVAIALAPTGGSVLVAEGLKGAMLAGMKAMEVSIATQLVTTIAAGNSFDTALESLTQKEYLRSLATAVVTAGSLNYLNTQGFNFFEQTSSTGQWDAASLANQATDIVINSAVSSGVETLINGEGSDEFFDSWKMSAMHMATSNLGAKVAYKIGDLTSQGHFNEAMRYISHAALGCSLGVATEAINKGDDLDGACSAGGIGAVIGEGAAAVYTDAMVTPEQRELLEAMKGLGLPYDVDINNITPEELALMREKLKQLQYDPSKQDLANMLVISQDTVNVGKLTAGLVAMMASLDVNIAANSAENSVQHNWLQFLGLVARVVTIATLPITIIETIETIERVSKHYDTLDEAGKREFLEEQIISIGTDLVLDAVFKRGLKYLPIEELEKELYVLIKSHPQSPAILTKVDGFLEDKLRSNFGRSHNPLQIAQLKEEIELKRHYRIYKAKNPGTSIKYEDVQKQHRNGKYLTENGRFANINKKKVKLGDGPDYRRNSNKEDIGTLVNSGYPDTEFKDALVTNPLTGNKVTVQDLVKERAALVTRKENAVKVGATGVNGEVVVNEWNAKIRKYSEVLGLARADHIANNYCIDCKATMLKSDYLDKSTNRQYDRIYQIDRPDGRTEILKIEAKGGYDPTYGTAQVGLDGQSDIISAQQGSKVYQDHIDENMLKKFNEYRDVYSELTSEQQFEFERMKTTRNAIKYADQVSYIGIEQTIDKSSNQLKSSSITFFD